MSLVPAVMTVTLPTLSGNLSPATAMRLTGSYLSGTASDTSSATSLVMRVMSTDPSPRSSILDAIAAICPGIFPAPKITSGVPWRTSLWKSTLAKPMSSKGSLFKASTASSTDALPSATLSSISLTSLPSMILIS